jgi:glycine oxidase
MRLSSPQVLVPNRPKPDIVVVGGGIVGAAVTMRLAGQGHKVTCIAGAEGVSSATGASGAMLGVLGELTPFDEPADLELRLDAWRRHPAWRETLGLPAARAGTFVVAGWDRPPDSAALQAMENAARQHGLRAERVAPGDVPELAPMHEHLVAGVLYLPDEAWVDGPALSESVLSAAVRLGAQVVTESAEAVTRSGDAVTGVRIVGGEFVECREVVLCTGADVPELLRASGLDAGLMPAVVPAKGVGVVLEGQRGPRYVHVLRTPNRQFACGLHVVPRGQHTVYVGSTNRAGSSLPGMTGRATAGEVSQLLTDVTRELAGPLGVWDIGAMVHGRRPLPVDGLPIAGRTAFPGLSVATGTYRNGVLLAPLMADAVAASLEGSGPADLSPQRAAPEVDVAGLLRRGLTELVDHWRHDDSTRWHEHLGPLLCRMTDLAFRAGPEMATAKQRTTEFLLSNGRPEMVPQAVIEFIGMTNDQDPSRIATPVS